MSKIKLIKEDTDISSLQMRKFDWDVEIDGVSYQVVNIPEYVHTIGSGREYNSLWIYPRNEEPTYRNLIQYMNNNSMGVIWGIRYEPHNYIYYGHDGTECRTDKSAIITRNGKKFYTCVGGMDEAKFLITKFKDHPLELNTYEWDKKAIGRKVFWRSEPGIITKILQNACVIIEPDGMNRFSIPAEFRSSPEIVEYYMEENYIKTEILDDHICWFR